MKKKKKIEQAIGQAANRASVDIFRWKRTRVKTSTGMRECENAPKIASFNESKRKEESKLMKIQA